MIDKKLKSVLELVAQGKTNKEIAVYFNFSEIYIKKLVSSLFKKYKVKNRIELVNEYLAEKMTVL